MPKYMILAKYTVDGMKGLMKDKGSGRYKAVSAACESVGGKCESMHFCLGEHDVCVICDMPNHLAVTRMCTAVCAAGGAQTYTVPLLTCEEMDQVCSQNVQYKPPGG